MKRFLLSLAFVSVLATASRAQHSDIEFSLDNAASPTAIVFGDDADIERTSEGIRIFESEFEEPLTGQFSTIDPGIEGDVNPTDLVTLRILDAASSTSPTSIGQGFVNFYNPVTDSLEGSGEILIRNQLSDALDGNQSDLLLNGTSATGDNPQSVQFGNGTGEAHGHVEFDIDDGAAFGAYGLLAEIEVNGVNGDITTSDPFWLIFNHQLDGDVFEGPALRAFSVAVPEPTTFAILAGCFGALALRRRRRA